MNVGSHALLTNEAPIGMPIREHHKRLHPFLQERSLTHVNLIPLQSLFPPERELHLTGYLFPRHGSRGRQQT